jgi:hypothetical protein
MYRGTPKFFDFRGFRNPSQIGDKKTTQVWAPNVRLPGTESLSETDRTWNSGETKELEMNLTSACISNMKVFILETEFHIRSSNSLVELG